MRRLAYLILLAVLAGSQAAAESPDRSAAAPFLAVPKERKISSREFVRQFERPSEDGYRFGEGDRLAVTVWDHPELTVEQVVGPDGIITLPVAGPISLLGLTRDDAKALIDGAFAKFYQDLAVTIEVTDYASNHVFILGRVSSPGVLSFDTPPTLLEAITRAGALPIGGIGADKAALTRCAIFRGRDRVAWIDLRSLLSRGDMSWNIRLQRDDVIYVPDADDQLVYVLGEVDRPGAVQMTPDMSFLDALAAAGGSTTDASNSKIHLVRPSSGLKVRLPMKELLSPRAELNISLEEGDVIYVPQRKLAKLGYFLQQINPAASLLVLGIAATK